MKYDLTFTIQTKVAGNQVFELAVERNEFVNLMTFSFLSGFDSSEELAESTWFVYFIDEENDRILEDSINFTVNQFKGETSYQFCQRSLDILRHFK